MTEEHQKLLRAMLEAKRNLEALNTAQNAAWGEYLKAQSAFMGKFASTDYPLGPFVVGTTLIEHERYEVKWPPTLTVFEYRDVIRCPTSE